MHRAHDDVHPRHPLEQRRSESLGHATHHAQHITDPLVPLQLPHPSDHPLLRVVPDSAGVHQHHVGLCRLIGADVPLPAEQPEEELRIGHVHLAAVGFDVDGLGHRDVRKGERRREKREERHFSVLCCLRPYRHSHRRRKRPLGIRPRGAPYVLKAEVHPGPLLGESYPGAERDPELLRLLTRHQGERQGSVVGAEADRPAIGSAGIRGELPPGRDLNGVLRTGAALRQQIAVGTRPGPIDHIACELELGDRTHPDAEAEQVGQVGLGDSGGVAIDNRVPVRSRDRRQRKIPAERPHHADVESHAGIRDLGALLRFLVGGVGKGSTRGDPVRPGDDVE